ncbi:MAG: hypothetical protein WA952_14605, partial [Lewinella sp.]
MRCLLVLIFLHFGCARKSVDAPDDDPDVAALVDAVLKSYGTDACLSSKSVALSNKKPSDFLGEGFSVKQAIGLSERDMAQQSNSWRSVIRSGKIR